MGKQPRNGQVTGAISANMLSTVTDKNSGRRARQVKRGLDLVIALLGLVLSSPITLIVSLAILLRMGRPVVFAQARPCADGEPFTLYKFRTMRDATDRQGRPLPDDERLTRLGRFLRRFSLDEIPQLVNVLRGDLSLVGPRPLLVEYLPLYTPEQARRHEMQPGITGWAQVNGRNAISWEQKFAYDVWYIDHWSLWLDLRILGRTVFQVLRGQGIASDGVATMPVFTGSANSPER